MPKFVANRSDVERLTASTEVATGSRTDRADTGYRSFRATEQNRTALIDPPLSDSELLLKGNVQAASRETFWSSLRELSRNQMLSDARQYTSNYRDLPETSAGHSQSGHTVSGVATALPSGPPIVMAGHQPTLFHPGVWFKNFALDRIASELGACAVNLVIDNDVSSGRSIRLPARDLMGRVRYETVAYDTGGIGIPFEQAKIRDLRQFDRFDHEVRDAIAPIVKDPCVSRLWPHARAVIRRCEIAGCALAQARHSLEAELGWQTLEVPLGVAVRGIPFARFAMEIIDDIERFHQIYNGSARHYRTWHGIRSSAHPVPNLQRRDEWWELPLWIYGNDCPARKAVWVRRVGGQLQVSDSVGGGSVGPHREVWLPSDHRDRAAAMLAESAGPEFKLRPRALMTTMFARTLLSDLFLHGIGGGKYDQLADQILSQFFGLIPPAFQVVSATVRLPGQELDRGRPSELAQRHRWVREPLYQGEKWVDAGIAQNDRDIRRKRELIGAEPPAGSKKAWHEEISRINRSLSDQLASRRRSLLGEIRQLEQDAAQEKILASREWSFCLFSLDDLLPSFDRMLG